MASLIFYESLRIYSSFFMYLLFTGIFLQKNISQYKQTNDWNWSRFLIALVMFSLWLTPLVKILHIAFPDYFNINIYLPSNEMGLITALACLPVLFGLMFLAYINTWKPLQFFPLFYYLFSLFYFSQTGVSEYIIYFNYVGGVLGIIGLTIVGFQLRDNNSIGIAIYFVIIYLSFLVNANQEAFTAVNVGGHIYGLFYATEKLHFFKEENDENYPDAYYEEEKEDEYQEDYESSSIISDEQENEYCSEELEYSPIHSEAERETIPVMKLSDFMKQNNSEVAQ